MKRLAIIGYGNLGKACEKLAQGKFDLVGIFSRRRGITSPFGTRVFMQDEIISFKDKIDVALICTGSANDVTGLATSLAGKFNTVDSFDTHARMRDYVADMERAAAGNTLNFVGIGWDPGIFSLERALFDAAICSGASATFWGPGASQGHSEAIRRIKGVRDAVQFTLPRQEAIRLLEEGEECELSDGDRHKRLCFVAAENEEDKAGIERQIKTMPGYFAPYETEVHFVSEEEVEEKRGSMPHGGRVIRVGHSNGARCKLETSLHAESNPDFTAGIMLAYAAANARLFDMGERGVRTILDIPVSALHEDRVSALKFV